METAVDAAIEKIVSDGVTEDEVSRAKQRLRASAVFARDSFQSAARVLGSALATGQTIEDVEAWPDRIAAVKPEDVKAAAEHVFQKRQSVTALLLGADGATKPTTGGAGK